MESIPDRATITDDQRCQRADLVEKARKVVPILAKNAAGTDENRRLAEENLAALRDAGLLSLLRPACYGGLETDMRTVIDIQKELAHACASTAWVYGISRASNFWAAMFSAQAQDDIWGQNPDVLLCGVLASDAASARRADGGWRVTGKWGYASGSLHAQWAIIAFPTVDANDSEAQSLGDVLAVVPISDLTVQDTWFVTGMRGTGSNHLVADDIFIPDHRVIAWNDLFELGTTPHKDSRLFRWSSFGALFVGFLVAPQVGLAEAALDYVIDKAKSRNIPYINIPQAVAPWTQMNIARAAALVDSANLHLCRAAAVTDEAADRQVELDERARARTSMDFTTAVRYAREAVRLLVQVHGSGTYAQSGTLERYFRDCEVASSHFAFNDRIFLPYGQLLLNIPLGFKWQV